MKKLFAPLLLFAFAGILLPSCSNTSKLSFNKRHYRSGDFVNLAGKTHTATVPIAMAPVRAKYPISAIVKTESPVVVNTSPITIHKTSLTQNRTKENDPIAIASNTAQQVRPQTLNITEGPSIQSKQIFSDVAASQGDYGSRSAGAALSLLWIVIVIILILWLVGILAGGFGLGGLLNILLIVALVLLILWLLRIL
jgi:hypothetical protein